MASPISEATIEETVLALDDVAEVQTWELEQCQAFWLTRAGRIFASTTDSHHRMGIALFDFFGEGYYKYLFTELHWVRGRTHCSRRSRGYITFQIEPPLSMRQKKIMNDILGLHEDVDVVLESDYHNLRGRREIEKYLEW